ncbi:hypothetical protein Psal027_00422 [Piscirickettsia salmonis]|uniref:Uncharacterized protein n=1 Tax=Piscirickettsia salmonis TaxID=1238 RepID=A0A9Q6PRK6_PISSA|nr:hypothetical protein Psal001_00423 [Piscirickettsia salmonis]QGN79811.1 hypothetical protein Psal002_00422 [Piscirickettsia salmonis]QGN83399.1 hypothetical protein Psal003_00420 [Piscirickettsia salmonis]QGN86913.1 hypothetical protein Psal004_00420 [Piscirickettsia salmonis]QGN90417.1 hypothetical protein Psal005_00420 [Piscirickettsia salmonis]
MTSLSEKIIKPKLGVLELAKQLGNVSKACDVSVATSVGILHIQ